MAPEGWQGRRANRFFVNEQSFQASLYVSATREIKARRESRRGGARRRKVVGHAALRKLR